MLGKPPNRRKERRPMGYFRIYNEWFQSYFDEHNEKPRVPQIVQWYNDNVDRLEAPPPSLKELKRHSKGLRPLTIAKAYSAEYYQRRRAVLGLPSTLTVDEAKRLEEEKASKRPGPSGKKRCAARRREDYYSDMTETDEDDTDPDYGSDGSDDDSRPGRRRGHSRGRGGGRGRSLGGSSGSGGDSDPDNRRGAGSGASDGELLDHGDGAMGVPGGLRMVGGPSGAAPYMMAASGGGGADRSLNGVPASLMAAGGNRPMALRTVRAVGLNDANALRNYNSEPLARDFNYNAALAGAGAGGGGPSHMISNASNNFNMAAAGLCDYPIVDVSEEELLAAGLQVGQHPTAPRQVNGAFMRQLRTSSATAATGAASQPNSATAASGNAGAGLQRSASAAPSYYDGMLDAAFAASGGMMLPVGGSGGGAAGVGGMRVVTDADGNLYQQQPELQTADEMYAEALRERQALQLQQDLQRTFRLLEQQQAQLLALQQQSQASQQQKNAAAAAAAIMSNSGVGIMQKDDLDSIMYDDDKEGSAGGVGGMAMTYACDGMGGLLPLMTTTMPGNASAAAAGGRAAFHNAMAAQQVAFNPAYRTVSAPSNMLQGGTSRSGGYNTVTSGGEGGSSSGAGAGAPKRSARAMVESDGTLMQQQQQLQLMMMTGSSVGEGPVSGSGSPNTSRSLPEGPFAAAAGGRAVMMQSITGHGDIAWYSDPAGTFYDNVIMQQQRDAGMQVVQPGSGRFPMVGNVMPLPQQPQRQQQQAALADNVITTGMARSGGGDGGSRSNLATSSAGRKGGAQQMQQQVNNKNPFHASAPPASLNKLDLKSSPQRTGNVGPVSSTTTTQSGGQDQADAMMAQQQGNDVPLQAMMRRPAAQRPKQEAQQGGGNGTDTQPCVLRVTSAPPPPQSASYGRNSLLRQQQRQQQQQQQQHQGGLQQQGGLQRSTGDIGSGSWSQQQAFQQQAMASGGSFTTNITGGGGGGYGGDMRGGGSSGATGASNPHHMMAAAGMKVKAAGDPHHTHTPAASGYYNAATSPQHDVNGLVMGSDVDVDCDGVMATCVEAVGAARQRNSERSGTSEAWSEPAMPSVCDAGADGGASASINNTGSPAVALGGSSGGPTDMYPIMQRPPSSLALQAPTTSAQQPAAAAVTHGVRMSRTVVGYNQVVGVAPRLPAASAMDVDSIDYRMKLDAAGACDDGAGVSGSLSYFDEHIMLDHDHWASMYDNTPPAGTISNSDLALPDFRDLSAAGPPPGAGRSGAAPQCSTGYVVGGSGGITDGGVSGRGSYTGGGMMM